MKIFRFFFPTAVGLMLAMPTNGVAQLSEYQRFEVLKYLDTYNAVFNDLSLYYVDTLEIKKLNRNIAFLLQQHADPYSEYISEEEMPDFRFQTTGEYGGIGSIISMRNRQIIINTPYKGMPAADAGLIPGDAILAIDGESMEGKTTVDASEKLKGQPNTRVRLTIQRAGESQTRELSIVRKQIQIDPVSYYGVIKEGIGYIYLSSFTTHSAESFKTALLDLTEKRHIRSLVIDVRNNGGGVVENCLEILNYFLPKKELLLSMHGRIKQMDVEYHAEKEAIASDLPIAILVNENSASASEILSGTIQDLDRGVVIGNRTYGKGLVQATRPLPYNGKLKLTTAHYYLPSGRSIQAINYANRDENGRVSSIPDSLTQVFYTRNRRPVRDGCGVLPDLVIAEDTLPTILYYLDAQNLLFDFVVDWRIRHPAVKEPSQFTLTDEMYDEFKKYVQSKDFTYDRQSEKILNNLKQTMTFEGYYDAAAPEFQALAAKLKPDLTRDLEYHKAKIGKYLAMEIMQQYYFEQGSLVYSLRDDKALQEATRILSDNSLYNNILTNIKTDETK